MVRCGDLKAGDKLPPEIELAQSLSLSRSTLREALKSLEAIGILETVRGQGTFVTMDARKQRFCITRNKTTETQCFYQCVAG